MFRTKARPVCIALKSTYTPTARDDRCGFVTNPCYTAYRVWSGDRNLKINKTENTYTRTLDVYVCTLGHGIVFIIGAIQYARRYYCVKPVVDDTFTNIISECSFPVYSFSSFSPSSPPTRYLLHGTPTKLYVHRPHETPSGVRVRARECLIKMSAFTCIPFGADSCFGFRTNETRKGIESLP